VEEVTLSDALEAARKVMVAVPLRMAKKGAAANNVQPCDTSITPDSITWVHAK